VAVFGNEHNTSSGDCLSNSANFAHSPAPVCPTTAEGDFIYTEGPVPAAGGSISDLQAESGSAPTGKKSATVTVIDETPNGTQHPTVMKCTIPAPLPAPPKTCSNTGAVPIEPGHYLMVQTGGTASATTWRVTFRY
jgi:hypothetical protein